MEKNPILDCLIGCVITEFGLLVTYLAAAVVGLGGRIGIIVIAVCTFAGLGIVALGALFIIFGGHLPTLIVTAFADLNKARTETLDESVPPGLWKAVVTLQVTLLPVLALAWTQL